MTEITAKTPWAGHTGDVPLHLDYFDGSMFEALELVAKKYPRNIAFDFMGKPTTYPQMIEEIKKCARSLKTIGVRAGDKVTIAMPNCPQAIYMFYAVNLVGGIANMIHPLSAEKEIEFYLNESESVTAITLDQFYNKFESIRQNTKVVNIIIASVKDELSKPVRAGYMLTEGRKIAKIPKDAPVIRWKEFMNMGKACFWNYSVKRTGDDPAVILYSGGTTGTTKGIVLTNRNFNALVRPHHALAGRALHPRAALYCQELREAHHQVSLQLHRGRAHALRGAAASAEHGGRGPQLAQGRVLRRRQPVDRAEEEAG